MSNTTLLGKFDVTIVGVTFVPAYPDNLHALHQLHWEGVTLRRDELPVALLVRNPNNEYDANAIEVHVPALGEYAMIGHLPRNLAARLAPELDAGVRWGGWVTAVRLAEGHEDRPGVQISMRRIEEEA